jgi:Uma2 family endonuclease
MSLASESHEPRVAIPSPAYATVSNFDIATMSDAPHFKHWQCSVEKYHEMTCAGILDENDQVELLEGYIVQKDKPADGPLFPLWRCSVEKYDEMVRCGILDENDRIELLEGWIVQKMPISPLHRTVTGLVHDVVQSHLTAGYFTDVQVPIALAESEPEPDLVVTRGQRLDFIDRHAGPADTALVVEVADSSLRHDRDFKKQMYAGNGIVIYWIVNLVDKQVEVYTEPADTPSGPDYASYGIFSLGDHVPLVIDGQALAEIPVQAIIPEQIDRPG